MTLDELNSAVATATGKPKSEASKAVAAVLHGIQDALSKGDKVSIAGFGVFEVADAPRARGPQPADRQDDQDRRQQGRQVQARQGHARRRQRLTPDGPVAAGSGTRHSRCGPAFSASDTLAAVDAAFGLVELPPAAGADVLAVARPRACRARSRSTDSPGPAGVQRQLAQPPIVPDVLQRPARQRIELDLAGDRIGLDRRQRGAHTALEPLAAGDPAGKTGQRLVERLGLADVAAQVGLAAPQLAVGIGPGEVRRGSGGSRGRPRAAASRPARPGRPGSRGTACRSPEKSPACAGRRSPPCRAARRSRRRTTRPWRSARPTARSAPHAATPTLQLAPSSRAQSSETGSDRTAAISRTAMVDAFDTVDDVQQVLTRTANVNTHK